MRAFFASGDAKLHVGFPSSGNVRSVISSLKLAIMPAMFDSKKMRGSDCRVTNFLCQKIVSSQVPEAVEFITCEKLLVLN